LTASIEPKVRHLSSKVAREKQDFFSIFPQLNDPIEAESHAILFLGKILFDTFQTKFPEERIETFPDLEKAKEYIDSHYTTPIKLDDLVVISGRSKYGLLRKFNAQYRVTPHTYLLNKRINHAKQLIRNGQTIAQTAVDCGFFDQSHFVKTFKQFVGVKPADFR
jgi:AraC-like DNA-binding protein